MLETDTSRVPVAPVTVTFFSLGVDQTSNVVVTPTSSSTVPRDVSGVLQMRVPVPTTINAGLVNLSLSIGGVTNVNQTTSIYVK